MKKKLLKDDVTNKQKFIDAILQHNSKFSQNFDVSRIIPVTNEARKQHYDKKDTELNNRQKQEENKSSEKSNEKNGSNKEKNRFFLIMIILHKT